MIAIVDYGIGNLRSVQKGFERVGYQADITSNPDDVARAERVVLPGVGAFGDAMAKLKQAGMVDSVMSAISEGRPFLGICVGLQMLFSESEELGHHPGLDVIPGRVRRFPKGERVPQIGWNQIHVRNGQAGVPLLKDIPNDSFFYFVHSYYVEPADSVNEVASTDYGIDYTSIAAQGNVYGVQFHPEKSQDLGLRLLKNFAELPE